MPILVIFQVLSVVVVHSPVGLILSMTDGTRAFSVTPIMMRALYTYLASLGTTAVGTLINYTLGVQLNTQLDLEFT